MYIYVYVLKCYFVARYRSNLAVLRKLPKVDRQLPASTRILWLPNVSLRWWIAHNHALVSFATKEQAMYIVQVVANAAFDCVVSSAWHTEWKKKETARTLPSSSSHCFSSRPGITPWSLKTRPKTEASPSPTPSKYHEPQNSRLQATRVSVIVC